jgi:hypothetical protein
MGDLEIGGTEQAEAAARAVAGKIARNDRRDRQIATHSFIPRQKTANTKLYCIACAYRK